MLRDLPLQRSRRDFLRGRGRTAVMRPPGALAEADFLLACTRCDGCRQACPESILRPGDGGFPVIDFTLGECSFCGDCSSACESGALSAERLADWPWRAAIDQRCLTRGGVVCRSCAEACPTRAIRFTVQPGVAQPELETTACSGCGACVAACPVGAIAMQPLAAAGIDG